MAKDKYVRFDWAAKRMLRNKANFGVLEGLITGTNQTEDADCRSHRRRT